MIVDEPLHAPLEPGQAIDDFGLQRLDSKKRNQSDHRADFQEVLFSVGELQDIVVEAVCIVPKGAASTAEIVHGTRDVNEMLKEFAGDVFVGRIFFGQLESHRQHVQTVHAHPACAVGLLEVASGGERRRAVKNSDVIEAEETTLKDIRAVGVFAVHPPGKIQQQLVK